MLCSFFEKKEPKKLPNKGQTWAKKPKILQEQGGKAFFFLKFLLCFFKKTEIKKRGEVSLLLSFQRKKYYSAFS